MLPWPTCPPACLPACLTNPTHLLYALPAPTSASAAGGWSLEWAGQAQRDHPAWLHPAVLVLTAAFDSLDNERAARQPLGLFGRLRAGTAAGAAGEAGEGAERQGAGWRGWLASALRFHGRSQL